MLNQERWKEIENKRLQKGAGKDIDHACVMEMVSYVAGEDWTDHPKCACPILTSAAIRLNDTFNDEHRELLKPLIPLLVGTRSTDAVQITRKRLFYWRNVTAIDPFILDFIKMPELAETLRKFENNIENMNAAAAFLQENEEAIRKAASAYAYVDAYAYAYVDASDYAYVDASDLRDKIAVTAVETLRMAIEIKECS